MADRAFNLAIIIGSTREARFGDTIGRWVAAEAAGHGHFSSDLIDLAEIELPPAHRARPTPHVDAFRARLAAADSFVIVIPEYTTPIPRR
ncbi:MAG TPA: NAD(P)H-dependent oxidoreductase [Dongiaceae bacterium]